MEAKAERVARAWREAREWLERGEAVEVHVAWHEVDTERLREVLEWLESKSSASMTSCVWRCAAAVDHEVAGVHACLEALEDGRIPAFSLHYELPLERQTLPFLITILRQEAGDLAVRGFTRLD